MKRFLNIILVAILVLVSVFGMVACADDDAGSSEKGLKYKKYIGEDFYTVYDYVDDGTTALSVPAEIDGVAVGRIASKAFENNGSIKKLVVPTSVTEIGAGAFAGMKAIEELTLPFVGMTANSDLYNGETEPATDKSVGIEKNFCYVFGTDLYTYGSTVATTYGTEADETATYYLPSKLTKVTIAPAQAYSIPMHAFNGVTTLSEIVLQNIDGIGEYAFNNCSNLLKINIPATVSKIWDNAFTGCTKLSSTGLVFDDVTAASALTEIANLAFYGTPITEIVIPASVNYIGESAFAGSALKRVTLSSNTSLTLAKYAFYKCKYLTEVIYNAGATVTVEGAVFQFCSRLDCSAMETDFTIIGANNFADTNLL